MKDSVQIIENVSKSEYKIALWQGGIKINGIQYVYNPLNDSLVRHDLIKKV